MSIVDMASFAALALGAGFSVVGGIGILRLPDFYSRLHAAGITDTLGAGLVLVGLMLQAGLTLTTLKLLIILAFMWLASPTATHALAKAALADGLAPLTKERPSST